MNEGFRVVGRRPMPAPAPVKKAAPKGRAAMVFLLLLAVGCLIARFWTPKDPAYMDLVNANKAPCGEFLFGTDTMGRDIFSMIFYGGGFFRLLFGHLAPNFFSSILFMVVMNIRSAMVAESTLSFMGLGLPLETISWGSMLSLAEKALLTGSWWIILIPGAFLALTLLSITDLAHNFQTASARGQRNL